MNTGIIYCHVFILRILVLPGNWSRRQLLFHNTWTDYANTILVANSCKILLFVLPSITLLRLSTPNSNMVVIIVRIEFSIPPTNKEKTPDSDGVSWRFDVSPSGIIGSSTSTKMPLCPPSAWFLGLISISHICAR